MSAVQWTSEQISAITSRGSNLLVAAAAGAGKTAVLVERIIKKITDFKNPIDIDKLLIVTFTNAAATEMRERIGEAIAKEIERNPNSKQLQRQLTLLHKASITTIHSFCLEVIKNNFHYIDLDANFRIADQTETVLLKMESLDDLFGEEYEKDKLDFDFINLLESYSGNIDDIKLREIVHTIYNFVQSFPWPGKWLEEKVEDFNIPNNIDFSVTKWGKIIIKHIKIELMGCLHMLQTASKIVQLTESILPYAKTFEKDINDIQELLNKCDSHWDTIYKHFQKFRFTNLTPCKKGPDEDKQNQVKDIRNDVKKKVMDIKDNIFTSSSEEVINRLNYLYPLMKYLSKLVINLGNIYSDKKKQRLLLDFNDLEHLCLEILTKEDGKETSEVAYQYQEKFEEIFIDEYQDSNMVQEEIMNLIARKADGKSNNIFMVGDIKQSIYRFRQARPELFLEKYHSYPILSNPLNNSECNNTVGKKIQLYKNFRSRKEILNGVNYIFEHIMTDDIGEIDYTKEEALNYGAKFKELDKGEKGLVGGAIELFIIDSSDTGNGDGKQAVDDIELEAKVVSNKIKELMKKCDERTFKVYDKNLKKYRPLQYKDIVILMRATQNSADVFVEQLSLDGIPVYADAGTGYFNTIEVQTMLAFLQVIDNPMQDIPLLSVLRSPVINFTPEELIDIRLANKEVTLYESLQEFKDIGQGEILDKVDQFLLSLEKWREKSLYMSTDELIWYLYDETGYYGFVGAMIGGKQRQANLKILFERARQYEKTTYKGLFNFINFIDKLKKNNADIGSAKLLSENEDVVRIMSIHKSKGLEFPLVILSGTGRNFNKQDIRKSILLHPDFGFGPDIIDYKKRILHKSLAKEALKYQINIENLSEEMRILYVALTRAKEKLIITGIVEDFKKQTTKWCQSMVTVSNELHPYELVKAKNYLDWIGPVVARHKDGDLLRNISLRDKDEQKDLQNYQDKSWHINVIDKDKFLSVQEKKEKKQFSNKLKDLNPKEVYSEYNDELIRRLSWNYKYKKAATIPTKISVTELKKHLFQDDVMEQSVQAFMPPLTKKPKFLEESKDLSAAEKGTAIHFVMQHLNFKNLTDKKDIANQIKKMVEDKFITKEEADLINIEKINTFLNSDIGQRLLKVYEDKGDSGVYREVPFNIELKCNEVYDNFKDSIYENEKILLQGVIDCYFVEDGEIVLIDYKTDYVLGGNTNIIKDKYRFQIEYYTRALEKILSKRVKERCIYLFSTNQVLNL